MENSGEDHPPSDSSPAPSAACKKYMVPDVIITHRLRDRELLRKRRAEAMEKDSTQWVLRMHKNQQQRRGRGAKRGRGRQPAAKATPDPEPTVDPQPELQEEAEPVRSEPALPEPVYQEQPPVLTIQNPVSGVQPVAEEGEPAAKSLDPAGEEEAVKPAEAEILEAFNAPVENDNQDNEFTAHVPY